MSSERRNEGFRKVLVIQNPVAGRRRHVFFEKTLRRLQKNGVHVDVLATGCRGDAERMARNAASLPAADRPDLVVAAGGDGTINEVINGLKGSTVPLGIIPLGTANVLAREIGVSQRSWQVARVLTGGAAKPVHLGEADGRRFIMMAGVGYDASVVARVNLRLKYRWGKLAYGLAGIRELFRMPRPLLRVNVDGTEYQSAWVVVAKGRHYGGAFKIARHARLGDDKLMVCIMPGTRRIDLARYLLAIVFARIQHQKDVRIIPAREVCVTDLAGIPVEIDGDLFGQLPVRLRIAPETLSLVQPA